ncbi:response regulator [Magnetovibrio sp. PR-2]|uniref:hybrid sensor histidine kinase/response regulator n=1 Tax=Magnetovibrio sp. PR-2 TaxID=3120356 RepID=UPI002FCE5B58
MTMVWGNLGFKGKASAVILAGIILSFALVWYGTNAVNLVNETERIWSDYNRTATATSQLMNRIHKNLGYGGFIHNFKNYVLRQDENYLTRMEVDRADFVAAVADYRALSISKSEREALSRLLAVIDEYVRNVALARKSFADGLGSVGVDNVVKVDDTPALIALEALSDAALERSRRSEEETQRWLDDTVLYLTWGVAIIPLVLFSAAVMVRFLWQAWKANEVAQAARREVEELLRTAPDAMLTVDEQGQIVRANHQAEAMFGYAEEELCSMWVENLVPATARSGHVEQRLDYFKSPHPRPMGRDMQLRAVARDGREIPVEISLSTLTQDGQTFATATVRDISDRIEAERIVRENEERLSLSEAIANVGTWDWDLKSSEMVWSKQLYTIVGAQPGKLEPSLDALKACCHPEDRASLDEAISGALERAQPLDLEHRVLLGDGTEKSVHQRGQIYRNEHGIPVRMIGMVLDITERRAIIDALEWAKAEADRANQSKSEFLANMSHEIRTPMNAILGMGYLALKTKLNRQQSDYLNKMLASARSLLRIINDILDFSKIEAGKLDLEATDFSLPQVLENVANVVGASVEDKKLEILFSTDADVPCWLVGDPLRLEQILINLASNAIKFTETGEVVLTVSLVHADEDGALQLKFSVRDTGVGMSQEQVSALFDAFAQADTSTTRRFGGTGLGLTISRRLVNLMGGDLGCESVEGEGSTFSFMAHFQSQGRSGPKLALPKNLLGAPALIVDDNPTAREILTEVMSSFGFNVVAVGSGPAALAELKRAAEEDQRFYDIVLMDWVMDEMDGLETTEQIRADLTLPRAPTVIMVTAYGRDLVVDHVQEAGLDGYLLKPVTPTVLFETIMEVFGVDQLSDNRVDASNTLQAASKALLGAEVLVVEDNLINQQVAQEILQDAGARVDIVEDGDQAYRKICVEKVYYDVVLMDLHMPVMDGYVSTSLIRENYGSDDLPIIAMTANAMRGEKDKCLDAGMNDFIPKPIDVDHFYATLLKWIPAYRLRQGQAVKRLDSRLQPEQGQGGLSAHQGVSLPGTLDGFDLTDGLDRMLGRPELYLKFLFKLADDHGEDAVLLREALAQGERDTAHRLAHTVKGVSGNLSAKDLYQVATALSSALKGGGGNIPKLVDSFEKELDRAVCAVRGIQS